MTRQWWLAGAAAAVLLASIATLTVLFLRTVEHAGRHFERAALSQAQFADVLAVQAAANARDVGALSAALARYRADVAAETRLIGDAEAQAAELADADAMARLAGARPPRLDALSRLVDGIAARERDEARATAAEMAALRARSRSYALLLAMLAAVSAAAGALGLGLANRRLARAVDERTARIVAVDASRRLFFAKVSHELRTPVTVMRGEAEVTLATAAGDPQALAAALEEVVVQGEQLDRRIGELLALSQAEDGRPTLARDSIDLAEAVAQAVARSVRHAAANGVRITTGRADPAIVRGDARWLEQALVAVIDNAIKFSAAGGAVEVAVAHEGGNAVASVADRGLGVLPAALPQLFDAYYQTEEGRARGGSGLGLALVRWIAEQHGGTATAAARDGGGCVVALRLPIAP